nr:hypothetical protein [uncultured Butyricicoccus sp.]
MAQYVRAGSLCGLSSRETLCLPVGVVLDLIALRSQDGSKQED